MPRKVQYKANKKVCFTLPTFDEWRLQSKALGFIYDEEFASYLLKLNRTMPRAKTADQPESSNSWTNVSESSQTPHSGQSTPDSEQGDPLLIDIGSCADEFQHQFMQSDASEHKEFIGHLLDGHSQWCSSCRLKQTPGNENDRQFTTPTFDLTISTSWEAKKWYRELLAHSKMSVTSFLLHLLLIYSHWHSVPLPSPNEDKCKSTEVPSVDKGDSGTMESKQSACPTSDSDVEMSNADVACVLECVGDGVLKNEMDLETCGDDVKPCIVGNPEPELEMTVENYAGITEVITGTAVGETGLGDKIDNRTSFGVCDTETVKENMIRAPAVSFQGASTGNLTMTHVGKDLTGQHLAKYVDNAVAGEEVEKPALSDAVKKDINQGAIDPLQGKQGNTSDVFLDEGQEPSCSCASVLYGVDTDTDNGSDDAESEEDDLTYEDLSDDPDWKESSSNVESSSEDAENEEDQDKLWEQLIPKEKITELKSYEVLKEDGSFEAYDVEEVPSEFPKALRCNKCTKMFFSFQAAHEHLKTCRKPTSFICDLCSRVYCTKQGLEYHLLHHKTTCEKCDFEITTQHEQNRVFIMRNHYDENHPLKMRSLCQHCGKVFSTPRYLKLHCIKVHKETGTLVKCTDCGKEFTSYERMTRHLSRVHDENKKIKCPYDDCQYKCGCQQQLTRHMKRKHLNIFEKRCTFEGCTAKFSEERSLKQHINYKHLNIRQCYCTWSNCGKAFKSNYQLKIHMRIHTDEKPLKCPHCDYSARQRNALNWHLKKHQKGSEDTPTGCSADATASCSGEATPTNNNSATVVRKGRRSRAKNVE